ncbi:hypothetical protein [Paragemmobacter straminiformis]|uniref:Uncharacterized protein n=1 Tax=Paragemmobacter straminiformis TaxID=2045119 RepID=A0A842I6D7_9RHOB|nr:hypothetical protein [Gemmobacter straminiformis]MBC2835151.1 hypothetical protein [Gemmobacter straminiformis]
MDLAQKTPEQLERIISRHRDAGKMSADLCKQAMAELSTRVVKGFNLTHAIDHLIDAARSGKPTDFKQLAIASGVFDEKIHVWGNWATTSLKLDRLCIYCVHHGLPQLTAMLGNAGGKIGDSVCDGFLKGLDAAGIKYSGEPRAIYEEHRKICIEWGASA